MSPRTSRAEQQEGHQERAVAFDDCCSWGWVQQSERLSELDAPDSRPWPTDRDHKASGAMGPA
eukprot:scaffold3307_cov265-Pinguiococcus_pyrenoidosus.AAC.8